MSIGVSPPSSAWRGNSTKTAGVYLVVFEQAVLPASMTTQRRSMFISLSGELLVLGLLLLIPLAWTDHLPHLDLRTPTLIGPPPPARPALPASNHSSGHASRQTRVIFRLSSSPHIADATAHVEFEPAGDLPPGVPAGIETGSSTILAPAIPVTKPAPPPDRPKADEPPKRMQAIAVSKGAQLAKLIHQVKPIYPPLAKAARISGTVQLLAVIARDGTIHNLQAL
jgi:protein TonB